MISKQFLRSIQLKKDDIPSLTQYPFDLPAIKTLSELKFHTKVTKNFLDSPERMLKLLLNDG